MKTKVSVYFLLLVVILALVIQGDTALGKTTDDSSVYAPVVFKQPYQTQTNSPSGALYVFFSAGTTNGNAGGRVGMNTICASSDPSSHFCSIYEIENAWTTTGVYFNTPYEQEGWLDTPANLGTRVINASGSIVVSDWTSGSGNCCLGWTYDNSGFPISEGRRIINGASEIHYRPCDEFAYVTCCKWIP